MLDIQRLLALYKVNPSELTGSSGLVKPTTGELRIPLFGVFIGAELEDLVASPLVPLPPSDVSCGVRGLRSPISAS